MKVWSRSFDPHAPRWARTLKREGAPAAKFQAARGNRLACPWTGARAAASRALPAWSPHSFRFVTIVAMLACDGLMTQECAAVEGAYRRSLSSHGYRHKGSDGALRHRPTRYGSSDES